MANPSTPVVHQMKKADTDIAILQVQYENLTEKVEDIKQDVKDIQSNITQHMSKVEELLKSFQHANISAHNALSSRIHGLEKWKWMFAGMAALAAAFAAMWPIMSFFLSMH